MIEPHSRSPLPAPAVEFPAHGGQLRQLADHYGIPVDQLLDFSANINPDGPPNSVLAALQLALADPLTLTRYPDLHLTEVKQAIARHIGVSPQTIAVANGFVPLLEAALRPLAPRRWLLPVPAFSEYRSTLQRTGGEVTPFFQNRTSNFCYDFRTMLKVMVEEKLDGVLLANPQNPSGACSTGKDILEFADRAAASGITVLLDEAFIDYEPEQSIAAAAAVRANLIVFRSVTKFFAIPGLRIAYAVSSPEYCAAMTQSLPPWPVATLASAAVCAALKDQAFQSASRERNRQRRERLREQLQQSGYQVYPSNANFLLLAIEQSVDAAALWETVIVRHRIVLRSCANFEGLASGHFRLAIRSIEDNDRLMDALRQMRNTAT